MTMERVAIYISKLGSEKEGEVFAEQNILVEDDLAARDLPIPAGAPQQILALADQNVGLGLDPVAVDQEAAFDRDFLLVGDRRSRLVQWHVRVEERTERHRLLGH